MTATKYIIHYQLHAIMAVETQPYAANRTRIVGWRQCFGEPFAVPPLVENTRLYGEAEDAARALYTHINRDIDRLQQQTRALLATCDALVEDFGKEIESNA